MKMSVFILPECSIVNSSLSENMVYNKKIIKIKENVLWQVTTILLALI